MATAKVMNIQVATSTDESSFAQILASLADLDRVVATVFSTITQRVDLESKKLKAIDSRLVHQRAKVEALRIKTDKAVCVMSPGVYMKTNDEPMAQLYSGVDKPLKPTRPLRTPVVNSAFKNARKEQMLAQEERSIDSAASVSLHGSLNAERPVKAKAFAPPMSCADTLVFNSRINARRYGPNEGEADNLAAPLVGRVKARDTRKALAPAPPSISGVDFELAPLKYDYAQAIKKYVPRGERLTTLPGPANLPLSNLAVDVQVPDILPNLSDIAAMFPANSWGEVEVAELPDFTLDASSEALGGDPVTPAVIITEAKAMEQFAPIPPPLPDMHVRTDKGKEKEIYPDDTLPMTTTTPIAPIPQDLPLVESDESPQRSGGEVKRDMMSIISGGVKLRPVDASHRPPALRVPRNAAELLVERMDELPQFDEHHEGSVAASDLLPNIDSEEWDYDPDVASGVNRMQPPAAEPVQAQEDGDNADSTLRAFLSRRREAIAGH